MTKIETLTMEEAITKGYTHFIEEEGEKLIKFSSIKEEDKQYYKNKKYFIVDMETPLYYTIDADTIKDLISDYVSEQDEFSDENDNLGTIAYSHDYSKLAEELNTKFEKHKYYRASDIEVIF